MAQPKPVFTQLKELGKSLDRRIPELQEEYENRKRDDEKAAMRNVLLRQLQEEVDLKKKDAQQLSGELSENGMEFTRFLALAKIVAQQQGQRIQELQSHLQKYGYEPPKETEESEELPEGSDLEEETPASPKNSEETETFSKSPPKQIHQGPWTLDRTPTLEDFGLHPNFMERVHQIVADTNRAVQEHSEKYGDGNKATESMTFHCGQTHTESKTPAEFSNQTVLVTPGVFDGRSVPDTGQYKVKYLESPPALDDAGKDDEIQATPRWVGFQRTMMEETPEPLSVKAKRVAKASWSAASVPSDDLQKQTNIKDATQIIQPQQIKSATPQMMPTTVQEPKSLSDTPPTPEMVSDFGKKIIKDMQASVRKFLDGKEEKKKSESIGTPQSPVFLTPGLKLKKGPAALLSDEVASPKTPVFLTPALNKTKSMPALHKQLEETACLTPQTPECMKRYYGKHTVIGSTTKTGRDLPKSYTTDDIHGVAITKTPEMIHSEDDDPILKTPQMLTNMDEVKRMLKSLDMNRQENTDLTQTGQMKRTAAFGNNVKIRTGVTPLVPKTSHLPYITPGKENRTLNFTGIQPEFNLIVEPITQEEYSNLPSYQRQGFTFNTLNKVVEKINALLEDKLANDLPLELAEEEVVKELGPSAFTLLMIMSCLGRINKCIVDGKFKYTVL